MTFVAKPVVDLGTLFCKERAVARYCAILVLEWVYLKKYISLRSGLFLLNIALVVVGKFGYVIHAERPLIGYNNVDKIVQLFN